MNALLFSLMGTAIIGFYLSLIIHFSNCYNSNTFCNISCLLVGIFFLLIPTIFFSFMLSKGGWLYDWDEVFRGCPKWMIKANYTFIAYAIINFCIILFLERYPLTGHWLNYELPAFTHVISSYCIATYFFEFTVFYSAFKVSIDEL